MGCPSSFHPDECRAIATSITKSVFISAFRFYGIMGIPTILRTQTFDPRSYFGPMLNLSTVGGLGFRLNCILSEIFQPSKFITFVSFAISAFCGNSIMPLEKRGDLNVWIMSQTIDIFWRSLEVRGLVKSFKGGINVVFGIAFGVYLYLIRMRQLPQSFDSLILSRFIDMNHSLPPTELLIYTSPALSKTGGKTSNCLHLGPCKTYYLSGFISSFLTGYIARSFVSLIFCFLSPQAKSQGILWILKDSLFGEKTRNTALFTGSLVGISRFLECFLKKKKFSDQFLNPFISGSIAGFLSFYFNGSIELACYCFARIIEIGLKKWLLPLLFNLDQVKYSNTIDKLLYTFNCGYLLSNSLWDPQNVRKGYLKYLNNYTGGLFYKILGDHSSFSYNQNKVDKEKYREFLENFLKPRL